MPISLPFLSVGPKVEVQGDRLILTTRIGFLLLTLGAWRNHITVDPKGEVVKIQRTKLWLLRTTRRVPFSQIQAVTYAMIDHSSPFAYASGQREGPETFDLGLQLATGEEIGLVRFTGEGAFAADVTFPHEWLDNWVRTVTDIAGSQQQQSLGLAEIVSKLVGAPLGPSRYF